MLLAGMNVYVGFVWRIFQMKNSVKFTGLSSWCVICIQSPGQCQLLNVSAAEV